LRPSGGQEQLGERNRQLAAEVRDLKTGMMRSKNAPAAIWA